MTAEEQAAWGSHLAAIMACLAVTKGPVLELGIGPFSTPVLHAFCSATNRVLVSVEHDREWITRLPQFHSGVHTVIHADYDEPYWYPNDLSVVFIDNSPGGERRAKDFQHFIDKSEFVIVHDYHRENEDAIKPFLKGINHAVLTWQQPPTLIASKVSQLPKVLCQSN